MNYIPMIFSLAFFITFGLYLFLGIYTIHLNPKALTHKVFLVLTVTLCLWSIGFSMMNIVNNPDSALLWGRVSAAGWSTMYSILVFFLLLLFNPSFLKKNKIVSLLIHIPAAIILYVFSISDTMARAQYDLVKIGYGWKDISINNIWNYLFYVYYIGYMIGALVLLWRWKKRSNEESVHKQANLIFYSMLIALVLGTASDVVLINIAPDISIQMAPIWILLPIAAIYYSIRKYSFLGTKESNEEEKILDSKTRARLNYYVAIIFYLGSMLAFLARYFPNTIKNPIIMKNTLTISVVLFVMGSTVLLLQLLKWQNIGDFLIISVVLLSIPVIILSFIQNSSITVWSIPLVLMIVSLVFNSRVPLILITIMSIITQVIVWIYGPIGSANVSEFDYLIRIGILLIAFRIGLVVNKIYVNKLKENSFQISLQKIVSDLSFEFIRINQNNLDDKIELLLELSGRFFNIDRSYVIFIDKDDNKMEYGYQWCNESHIF